MKLALALVLLLVAGVAHAASILASAPSDHLFYDFPTAFGAVLGLMLHWLMSWQEWRKIGENAKLPFGSFVMCDPPGALIGFIATLILYLSLPALVQEQWVADLIGFKPQMNFFTSAMLAWFSNSFFIKLMNMRNKGS